MRLLSTSSIAKAVNKIIIWQIALVFCIGFVFGWAFTVKAGISFMLGGAISIIPGVLFAGIFLRTSERQTTKEVTRSFFYGEAVKWLISAVLFILVFQWKSLKIIPLFLGVIVAQLGYWIALI